MSPEKKLADNTGDTFFYQFYDALISRKTASLEISSPEIGQSQTWHQGFTKRTQTPRDKNNKKHALIHVVPEIETDESNTVISYEQFYYQVPVFSGQQIPLDTKDIESVDSFDQLNSINPTDFELAEFATDKKESFQTEEPWVKFEDEKSEAVCVNIHAGIYDLNIHDTSYKSGGKMLKLDYDGIIAGWDNDRSPWTTGDRPDFDSNDPCMQVGCGKICGSGDMRSMTVKHDVGREARVLRYREKRQTRLFSKKIRYEVRKLNAEMRPRMKGRFVKRSASFSNVV